MVSAATFALSCACIIATVMKQGNAHTRVYIEGGQVVGVGDNVTIHCQCSGSLACFTRTPLFRIGGSEHTWTDFRDERVIQHKAGEREVTSHRETRYTIILSRASMRNNGTTYQCSLPGGSWEETNNVTLTVEGNSPTRVSILGGRMVRVGENVTIDCHCSGDITCFSRTPLFRIGGSEHTWADFTEGRVIQHRAGRKLTLSLYETWYTIVLSRVSTRNNGTTYQCSLPGGSWEETNMVTLAVEGPNNSNTNSSKIFLPENSTALTEAELKSTRSQISMTATTAIIVTEHITADITKPNKVIFPTTDSEGATTVAPEKEVRESSKVTPTRSLLQTTAQVATLSTPLPPVTKTTHTENSTTEGGITVHLDKVTEPTKDDAPTYVYVAVGSGVGIVVYILTIVLIGLVISLKITAKKGAQYSGSSSTSSWDGPGTDRHQNPIPMVTNPVYSDMMTPSSPAPPYFKDDPCMFGDRQVIVNMDSRYHDVPQRKSVAAESLYDYIDMQREV